MPKKNTKAKFEIKAKVLASKEETASTTGNPKTQTDILAAKKGTCANVEKTKESETKMKDPETSLIASSQNKQMEQQTGEWTENAFISGVTIFGSGMVDVGLNLKLEIGCVHSNAGTCVKRNALRFLFGLVGSLHPM